MEITITDWMQDVGTLIAVAMSGGSLFWQWRTVRRAQIGLISTRVEEINQGAWEVTFSAEGQEQSAALSLQITSLSQGVRLFQMADLPWKRADGEIYAILHPRRDLAMAPTAPQQRVLSVPLDHGSTRGDSAKGTVGIFTPDKSFCRVRVRLLTPGRRLALIARTMLISPSA